MIPYYTFILSITLNLSLSPIFLVISLTSYFLFHQEQAQQIQNNTAITIPAMAPLAKILFAVKSKPPKVIRVSSYQTPFEIFLPSHETFSLFIKTVLLSSITVALTRLTSMLGLVLRFVLRPREVRVFVALLISSFVGRETILQLEFVSLSVDKEASYYTLNLILPAGL